MRAEADDSEHCNVFIVRVSNMFVPLGNRASSFISSLHGWNVETNHRVRIERKKKMRKQKSKVASWA